MVKRANHQRIALEIRSRRGSCTSSELHPFTFSVSVQNNQGTTLFDLDHTGNNSTLYPYATIKVAVYNNDDGGQTDTTISFNQTNPSNGHNVSYEGVGNTCSGTPTYPDTSSGAGFSSRPLPFAGLCQSVAGGQFPFQPGMIQVGIYTADANQ